MGWVAYFDASALVKRYTQEHGTALVNELFRLLPATSRACSMIGIPEVVSILVRKKNDGRIDESFFQKGMLALGEEFIDNEEVLLSGVDDGLILASLPWIEKHNLNATDALLLHSVVETRAAIGGQGNDLFFVSSDRRLLRAMQAEEIPICDPGQDSLEDLHRLVGSSVVDEQPAAEEP